jgi:glycosyltransferase 2 family protein
MSIDKDVVKRELSRAFRIVCIVGVFVALWLFVRKANLANLADTFERATLWPVIVAVVLNLVSQNVKAFKWKIMLAPRHRVPFSRLLRYEFAAQAASSTTPVRAGEVLRFWMLKQEGVPATTTAALIALKKLLEGVGLTVLVLPVPWLISGLPAWVKGLIFLFAALMIFFLALLTVAARRADPAKPPNILRSLVGGMAFLCDSRRLAAALAMALVGEAADFGAAALLLYALHVHQPIAVGALSLFMVDVSNLLPGAPGQLGTFEVGAFTALGALHIARGPMIAFALLFHAQQVLPQVVIGLPLEVHFFASRRRAGGDVELADESADRAGAGPARAKTADEVS